MTTEPTRTERWKYYGKYTAGTYTDALASMPIWVGEKAAGLAESIYGLLGKETPEFLTVEYTRNNSPTFQLRERLRDNLDTRPGVLYLQSNLVSTVPFVLAGIPAAEAADSWIKENHPNLPELGKLVGTSLATLGAQLLTAYTAYMGNEIRTNSQKYKVNGKFSLGRIGRGFWNTIKGFAKFDLAYAGAKTVGQSWLLHQGKDPGVASALFDSAGITTWYAFTPTIGLSQGLIETTQTRDWGWEGLEHDDTTFESLEHDVPVV